MKAKHSNYVYWPHEAKLRRHKRQLPPRHHDHSGTHGRRKVWFHHAHNYRDGIIGGVRFAEPDNSFRCDECKE